MDCFHETHTRDPADHAVVRPSLVCLSCGILGDTCDRCARFYPSPPFGYLPDDWCRACDCCPRCCTELDRGLTPDDVIDAIETAIHFVANDEIPHRIRAASTRDEAIAIARRECSTGGVFGGRVNVSGFRDRFNKGRGLTAECGHRKGVVTWAAIADYVRAPVSLARAAVPGQQLSLFG